MGRPINKRNFGDTLVSINVQSYRRVGGIELAGDDTVWIKRQKSTLEYVITNGTWEEPMVISNNIGALAEGEFSVDFRRTDGSVAEIVRIKGRTCLVSNRGNIQVGKWASNFTSIVNVTQADPAVVTSFGHGLETGDRVTIYNVNGMTDLNTNSYSITVVDENSFSLDGVDSTGFGSYDSGGVWTPEDLTGGDYYFVPRPLGGEV